MLKNIRAAALAAVLGLTCASGAWAGGPFKVGYLDLDKVKRDYPEAQRAEMLRLNAESQLRDVVANVNKELEKAQKENKKPEEIEKMKREYQLQINGMQEAFRSMVIGLTNETNRSISAATYDAAKEKGLEMVVDVNSTMAGGDKLASCENLTDAVLRKLNTPKVAPAATPAAKP